jgi:hypothetical protein
MSESFSHLSPFIPLPNGHIMVQELWISLKLEITTQIIQHSVFNVPNTL